MRAADWMGRLLLESAAPLGGETMGAADNDLRLTELVIPGTHHSGSYSIPSWSSWCGPLGRKIGCTQSRSVYEQLCSGARYLDLRVAPTISTISTISTTTGDDDENGSFSIWHNIFRGARIDVVLQQIRDFCRDHPDEIVIVELVPEFGRPFTDGEKERCLAHCLSQLDGLLLPCYSSRSSNDGGQEASGSAASSVLLDEQCPTILQRSLRQIVSEGPERVLLVLHHRFDAALQTPCAMLKPFAGRFLQGSMYLMNPWHNTNRRQVLQERNLRCVQQVEAEECAFRRPNGGDGRRRRLVCNQLVATPQAGSAVQILTLIGTGTRSLWPRVLARDLYRPSPSPSLSSFRTIRGKSNADKNNSNDSSLLEWFQRTTAAATGSVDKSTTTTKTINIKNEGAKWNICSLDFIELCPQLVEAMILANTPRLTDGTPTPQSSSPS